MKLFTPVAKGIFLERPNRFIVMAEIEGKIHRTYCPNPGRLIELLLPGTELLFEINPGPATDYTLCAAIRNGQAVPLYSSRANRIAKQLILPRLFPDKKNIKAEYTHGNSRFDFCINDSSFKTLIEVKACTLIEYNVASFPDAPTSRGLRHITELANLDKSQYKGMVIFVIFNSQAELFIPNWHTDFNFAQALFNYRKSLNIKALGVETSLLGDCQLLPGEIPIKWNEFQPHLINGGVYLYLLKIENSAEIEIGKLGKIPFQKGWYVYVGSAKINLDARIKRHLKTTKKFHWHIDYLGAKAKEKKILEIRTSLDRECSLAQSIQSIAKKNIPAFGSSDCQCKSHLFYFTEKPLHRRDFLDILFRYRYKLIFNT